MVESKDFVCVNCGKPAATLYRTYGPSVLKLNKCRHCKCIVDHYIEYDNVIVMIDTVLISKEALRHVIYNIKFKLYWKLLVIQTILETYGVWRNDSLFNIAINTLCKINANVTSNSMYLDIPTLPALPEYWQGQCSGWAYKDHTIDNNIFIWEKDFYMQIFSTLAGIITFILTIFLMMKLMRRIKLSQHEVCIGRMLKAFSVANFGILFTLPMLIWGNADTSAETRTIHYSLVFAYSFVVFLSSFTVLFGTPVMVTLVTLTISYVMKYLITFHLTPVFRGLPMKYDMNNVLHYSILN